MKSCIPGRIHYWVLESAEQATLAGRDTSYGICKHCSSQKRFRNSAPMPDGRTIRIRHE